MIRVLLVAGALVLGLAASAVLRHDREPWQAGMSGNGFAVVELFTSEGCSSCPPADALVARIQQEDKDLPVYILAYHVDYWDRLGWKDVFSDGVYSDRQRKYAAWLNLSSIYTPQVVVNGRKEMVGSQAGAVYSAIKGALAKGGGVQLSLSGLQLKGGRLDWNCTVEGGKGTLVIAVVERSAVTSVKAGENSGRTLSHVQIVRSLAMSALDGKGNAAGHLAWPVDVAPENGEVIAFLQNEDTGQIVAATRSAVGRF